MLIEPIVLIKNRYIRRFDGGNITEHIPHDLEVIIHLTAAAHIEALGDIFIAIAASACQLQLFQQVNTLSFHLTIAHQIKRSGKSGKPGADDIGGFVIDALGFFGTGKALVGSGRIIHK